MSDLHTDAKLILETAQSLEGIAYEYEPETVEPDLIAWAMLEEANRALAAARAALAKRLAEVMPDKRVVVEGAGVFERHRKKDRTQWDKDDLLRAVLDTRQFDEDGVDASPLDKVLRVWNLPAPRVTALREMGLDADEFCHVETGGWTLQLIANAPITDSEAAA